MAFSQTEITDVRVTLNGADLFVAWSSTASPNPTFQVYVDRRLAWYGTAQRCHVPIPSGGPGRNIWVEVGTVDASEPTLDYSLSLVAPGGRSERAQLSWSGGTYLDPSGLDNLQGFWIYQSPSSGLPVDLSSAVATVAAYPGGWINDGFGKGGFGGGGFGRAATLYDWQSGPLSTGAWEFAVLPFDRAGNALNVPQPVTVTINAAPRPPAIYLDGSRLTYTYPGPTARQLTLYWLASPSDSG